MLYLHQFYNVVTQNFVIKTSELSAQHELSTILVLQQYWQLFKSIFLAVEFTLATPKKCYIAPFTGDGNGDFSQSLVRHKALTSADSGSLGMNASATNDAVVVTQILTEVLQKERSWKLHLEGTDISRSQIHYHKKTLFQLYMHGNDQNVCTENTKTEVWNLVLCQCSGTILTCTLSVIHNFLLPVVLVFNE